MKQELQNQINVMAATLRPQISITQGEGGIAADTYVKTLPEGITLETVQKLQDHNAIFFPAVTTALGEESIEAMKKGIENIRHELEKERAELKTRFEQVCQREIETKEHFDKLHQKILKLKEIINS